MKKRKRVKILANLEGMYVDDEGNLRKDCVGSQGETYPIHLGDAQNYYSDRNRLIHIIDKLPPFDQGRCMSELCDIFNIDCDNVSASDMYNLVTAPFFKLQEAIIKSTTEAWKDDEA